MSASEPSFEGFDGGSKISVEQLDEWYDDYVDVTTRVECFHNGKTFECDCGQGFGLDFQVAQVDCPSCGATCVDRDYMDRDPPKRDGQQSTLGEW